MHPEALSEKRKIRDKPIQAVRTIQDHDRTTHDVRQSRELIQHHVHCVLWAKLMLGASQYSHVENDHDDPNDNPNQKNLDASRTVPISSIAAEGLPVLDWAIWAGTGFASS
jgi:hypothetical protein